MDAQVGDQIVVESNKVGAARKLGQVVEVLDAPGGQHYRVAWEDGHESIVFPGSDASVVSVTRQG